MFSLICVWINGWVNNREAGDLRRHLGHYDVIVMFCYYLRCRHRHRHRHHHHHFIIIIIINNGGGGSLYLVSICFSNQIWYYDRNSNHDNINYQATGDSFAAIKWLISTIFSLGHGYVITSTWTDAYNYPSIPYCRIEYVSKRGNWETMDLQFPACISVDHVFTIDNICLLWDEIISLSS